MGGGPDGDGLIEVHINPHPVLTREGDDIHLTLPVTLKEALLGGRITVPMPPGSVAMAVPKRSDTGTRLRLRGRASQPTLGGPPATIM